MPPKNEREPRICEPESNKARHTMSSAYASTCVCVCRNKSPPQTHKHTSSRTANKFSRAYVLWRKELSDDTTLRAITSSELFLRHLRCVVCVLLRLVCECVCGSHERTNERGLRRAYALMPHILRIPETPIRPTHSTLGRREAHKNPPPSPVPAAERACA